MAGFSGSGPDKELLIINSLESKDIFDNAQRMEVRTIELGEEMQKTDLPTRTYSFNTSDSANTHSDFTGDDYSTTVPRNFFVDWK